MNKKFKIIFSIGSIALLSGCSLEANPDSTAIMTAVNYEGDQRIVYSLDDDYHTPKITDEHTIEGQKERGGQKLAKGDYKPVWRALQNRLGINLLEHQAAANSGDKKSVGYFRDNWMTKTYADISMGTVYDITNYSVSGNTPTILDLKPYLDQTEFDEKTGEIVKGKEGPLPNIAKFFHDNPGVKMSVVTAKHSNPAEGAIYYVPYFDGFNELEKGTIIRADYTKRLLDDDPDKEGWKFDNEDANKLKESHFTPCNIMEDGVKAPAYTASVPNVDEDGKFIEGEDKTIPIQKNEAENIIIRQDKLIKDGKGTSYELAKDFKDYLYQRYGQNELGEYPFGKNASDLFLGWKACYDTDELVALMRLVKASSRTLFGKDENGKWIDKTMITMMPRACDNMRGSDMYRWAGQTFGARGLESRNMYLYINGVKDYSEYGYGKYGKVHDARGSEEMVYVLNKLKSLYDEGLILKDFDDKTATGTSEGKFADETLYSGGGNAYAGFMLYDYPKDLNDWNKYRTSEKKKDDLCNWVTKSYQGDAKDKEGKQIGYSYDLRAIVASTVNWDTTGDGKPDGEYFPFTESWTSLKTSALCLNAKLVNNDAKREATFKLIDYIYSPEGMILYNYGPWEDGYITERAGKNCLKDGDDNDFQKKYGDPDPKVDYIEYQGERFPRLTGKAYEQHQEVSGLLRKYVGGTIPFGFKKLTVVPYQTMHDKTRHGVDVINKAVEAGSFRHVLIGAYTPEQVEQYKNPFYQICPSAFFLSKGQSSAVSSLLDKNTLGSMFTDSSSSNFNIWDSLVMGKQTRLGVTLENYMQKMEEWKVRTLETYYQDAFEIMSQPIKDTN